MSQRQLFLNHLAQTTDFPLMLEIASASGIYMYTTDGQAIIDLISGIGVSNVGHCHPNVVNAVKKQAETYMHLMVYGEVVQTPQNQLAQAIINTLPSSLDNIFFMNSGSEAIEGAMKLAKRYTGRAEFVACHNAYHGSSHGAMSVGGSEEFKTKYRPLLPGIRHVQFGNIDDLRYITPNTAAFVVETVQGEAGIRVGTKEYFQALRQRCNETGTLLILDEIQTGFGRTGKFWGFEHYDIVPDIITCAKGMGGGMPISAFISSKDKMAVFKNNPILGHISTFGGHPVSCAASLATIQTIQEEGLLDEVAQKAHLFKTLLVHPKIKQIRNKGLLMAVEFESFEVLKPIIDKAMELGVLTDWFLNCDNSLRIAPPLIITEEQIRDACKLLLQAIEEA
ncbi:aspartate aminotransferase family protein [uncultured Microscilla sp.]|uniref:aspartate aminotransferase family protein n=1 Tax=uncultured Microscilla sp. TaxID=432653 RepID=UPI00260CC88E|nr:aspartate aminotransferase family protein [uncultured Microscilla sp.]